MELDFKTNVTFGLKTSTVKDLDKLYVIEGLSSRAELGRNIITDYLSQKKIREKLIS
ncbi:MAG: hypothetical protein WCG95_00150 [bacterium]